MHSLGRRLALRSGSTRRRAIPRRAPRESRTRPTSRLARVQSGAERQFRDARSGGPAGHSIRRHPPLGSLFHDLTLRVFTTVALDPCGHPYRPWEIDPIPCSPPCDWVLRTSPLATPRPSPDAVPGGSAGAARSRRCEASEEPQEMAGDGWGGPTPSRRQGRHRRACCRSAIVHSPDRHARWCAPRIGCAARIGRPGCCTVRAEARRPLARKPLAMGTSLGGLCKRGASARPNRRSLDRKGRDRGVRRER